MPSSVARGDRPPIVHVVGSLQGGGAERCVRELVPRLRARGADAEIATVYMPNLGPLELEKLGCAVHSRPKRPGFDAAHCWWLSRVIASRRPAIVHTHQWAGKYVGRFAAILAGVPAIVHTEHSPNPVFAAERLMTQMFWRRTGVTITFSEQNADVVRRREPVRHFEIIRNGIAIPPATTASRRLQARSQLDVADGTVVFAIVASLQERKNHRLAFAALAQIKDEPGPPLCLSLFGDGVLSEQLVRLSAELGIAGLVRFHGFRSDVRELLPGIDVLLSVSLLEMAPISILEAMAASVPVIAAPHAGSDDMVRHEATGLLVDWDVDAVAAAMRRARNDAAWRTACGAAGRARAESNHDIEKIADQHMALYDRMLRTA